MFVSAPAVAHFFAARPVQRDADARDGVRRAWATGPGTAAALTRAGVARDAIDLPDTASAQWDSEALWQQVRHQFDASLHAGPVDSVGGGNTGARADLAGENEAKRRQNGAPNVPQAGRRVLIVRGADARGCAAGRDWLSRQLQAVGVAVQFAQSYERHQPQWSAATRGRVLGLVQTGAPGVGGVSKAPPVWVFSSSEAIANLQALMPGHSWAQARAVATHPRIAQSARDAGFGVVCLSRPGLDAVRASIKSFNEQRVSPSP